LDAAELQQWHKVPRLKIAFTAGKEGKCSSWDHEVLVLKIAKGIFRPMTGPQEVSDWILWRGWCCPEWKKTLLGAEEWEVCNSWKYCSTDQNRKKENGTLEWLGAL
jgi:hypothetical protein